MQQSMRCSQSADYMTGTWACEGLLMLPINVLTSNACMQQWKRRQHRLLHRDRQAARANWGSLHKQSTC